MIGNKPSIKKDLEHEYVQVSNGYSSTQRNTLAATIDDLETEVDFKTYDRMENDSTMAKCKKILITNVLSDDLRMNPGATEDEVDPERYQTYVKIMEFCERMVKGTNKPFRESMEQILSNAIQYGHGISEVVWEYRMDGFDPKKEEVKIKSPKGDQQPKLSLWSRLGFGAANFATTDDPILRRPALEGKKLRLMPKSVKSKPRGAVRFVVDDFLNEIGMVPDHTTLYGSGGKLKYNQILARNKFMVFTMNKRDEDPRGKSSYRPAFNWYNIKSQVPSELLRFILEESVPKAVGTLAPGAAPFEVEKDADGNVLTDSTGQPIMVMAAESFARQIVGFRSGSGAVIPNGATLEPFKKGINTDADMFPIVIKVINDEIENAILLQTLAQSEGAHQARSAAQQVAELLYNLTFWIKWGLAQMILNDFLAVGVRANFGEWAVEYLPMVSLGDFVKRDWTMELDAYANAYDKGLLDDTQRAAIMANLDLPKPGPSRQELGVDKQEPKSEADVNKQTEKKDAKQTKTTRVGPRNTLGHHTGWFGRN